MSGKELAKQATHTWATVCPPVFIVPYLPRFPQIDVLTGVISTVAGNGGQGGWNTANTPNPLSIALCRPNGLAFDAVGDLFISDFCSNHIIKMTAV